MVDERHLDWVVAVKTKPRDVFDIVMVKQVRMMLTHIVKMSHLMFQLRTHFKK